MTENEGGEEEEALKARKGYYTGEKENKEQILGGKGGSWCSQVQWHMQLE
jgi:hypothetical protein